MFFIVLYPANQWLILTDVASPSIVLWARDLLKVIVLGGEGHSTYSSPKTYLRTMVCVTGFSNLFSVGCIPFELKNSISPPDL